MERLTFNIELRRMNALPRILMLVARLGGAVRSVHAESHMMGLSVDAPIESAHRFGPQLRRVIDVLEVTEAPDGVPPVASQVERPVASQVEPPVASEVERPVASEVERPVASEVERPVASEVERPAAGKSKPGEAK